MSAHVIAEITELTPDWLSAALSVGGAHVHVHTVNASPIGTGQMGSTYRLDITYGDGGGPAHLVVKLPPPAASNPAFGATGYRAETTFYRDLAARVDVRVPRCYYADVRDDASAFTLLLEDMTPAVQGDQIAGCSVDEVRAAMLNVVGLHASTWCDPALHDIDGLITPPAATAEVIGDFYSAATEQFVARHSLTEPTAGVLRDYAKRYASWARGHLEPFSLVHNDYRLDNLLFAPEGSAQPVTAVDWQVVGIGNPLQDIAVLVATGLPTELRGAAERELVNTYYDALLAGGVTGYAQEQCWDDYRFGLFYAIRLAVFGAFAAQVTERGARMFEVMVERTAAAVTELDALSLL